MAIVKQTLHPEGDTGTDIYPKTSVDQIENLPVSAASQLYAHYLIISVNPPDSQYEVFSYHTLFINSKATPVSANNLEELYDTIFEHITGLTTGNGVTIIDKNGSKLYTSAVVTQTYKSNNKLNFIYYLYFSDTKQFQNFGMNLDSYFTQNPRATLVVSDEVVRLGSNAG